MRVDPLKERINNQELNFKVVSTSDFSVPLGSFSKIKDRMIPQVTGVGPFYHHPSVIFSKEGAIKLLACFKELFAEEGDLNIDEYLAKFRDHCESIKSDDECIKNIEVIKTICEIAIKSPVSHLTKPELKGVVSEGVTAFDCISDLSTALRAICDYTKDSNPLMSSIGLTTGASSFAGLISVVVDFKELLRAYHVRDRDSILEGIVSILMGLNRSAGGFSFLIERFASMGAAAGNIHAAHLAASSGAIGVDFFGVFYALLGFSGCSRLNNLAWHSEKLGIALWEPKDLHALNFFMEKIKITPSKVFEELKTRYGSNVKEMLRKEAKLQAKTICLALKNKGKATGIGDFIEWGKGLLGVESLEEKTQTERFSKRLARARGKENEESLRWLIDLSKFHDQYPELKDLDQEALQGLSIVCSHMEAKANRELERLSSEESVLKVQNYVERVLNGFEGDIKTDQKETALEVAKGISKELRAAYWKKVRESAGLVLISGLGICVMVLGSLFNPLIVLSGTIFLNAFMAYGYDYDSVKSMFASKAPLKPYDKLAGWASLNLGLVSVVACAVLLSTSIASFGVVPLSIAAVVLTIWIVSSCYNLNNLYARERFWNENEKIWQGQTLEGLVVRVDAPRSLSGRVTKMKQDEFSERIERIALHKIAESIIPKGKKKEAEANFRLNHSIVKVDEAREVNQNDLDNAMKWFNEIKKIVEEEEGRLMALLSDREISSFLDTDTETDSDSISSDTATSSETEKEIREGVEDSLDEISEVSDVTAAPEALKEMRESVQDALNVTPQISEIYKKKVLKKTNPKSVLKASFPPVLDSELEKKIAKVKMHIERLEEQRLHVKRAGAGRNKKNSLTSQIDVHKKRLKELESDKKSG